MIKKLDNSVENNQKKVVCWASRATFWEFLYFDDLKEACILVLENLKPDKKEIKVLNVGIGNDIQIKKVVEIIIKKCGFMVR